MIMSIPILTEQMIRAHSVPQIFVWGKREYHRGAVISLIQRGDLLEAEVEGHEENPYFIVVEGDTHQLISAQCSCAYEGKGWCKHVVAVLLKYAVDFHNIEQRPHLETLLGRMTVHQLQELVLSLVKQQHHLIKAIETHLSIPTLPVSQPLHLPHAIHAKAWYRQIREFLDYGFENDPIRHILTQISTFILSGDKENSFILLELMSEQAIRQWKKYEYEDDYEDEGGIANFFNQLDQLWAEAILTFFLDLEQREYWDTYLNKLENQIVELGGDFTTALNALHYYWDYLPLQEIFSGVREHPLWEEEIRKEKHELVQVYLRLLVRQQRYDAYLQLAKVQQHYDEYVQMAWRLNQFPEVFDGISQYLKSLMRDIFQRFLNLFQK